jgi:hypothetical protein
MEQREDHTDRVAAIVLGWLTPSRAALRAGEVRDTSLLEANYDAVVDQVRAALGDGRCSSCGQPFSDAQDVRLDYSALPRHPQDGGLQARHRWLLCGRCAWNKRYALACEAIDQQLRAQSRQRATGRCSRRRDQPVRSALA